MRSLIRYRGWGCLLLKLHFRRKCRNGLGESSWSLNKVCSSKEVLSALTESVWPIRPVIRDCSPDSCLPPGSGLWLPEKVLGQESGILPDGSRAVVHCEGNDCVWQCQRHNTRGKRVGATVPGLKCYRMPTQFHEAWLFIP